MSRSWTSGLNANEVVTVQQIARLTGRPAGQIIRMANSSRLAQANFQMAVFFATGERDCPGENGQWGPDPEQQAELFRHFAACVVGIEPIS